MSRCRYNHSHNSLRHVLTSLGLHHKPVLKDGLPTGRRQIISADAAYMTDGTPAEVWSWLRDTGQYEAETP